MPQITMNNQRRLNSARKLIGTSTMPKMSDDSSAISSFASAQSTRSNGWGSIQSRKSYACLTSLADVEMPEKREILTSPIEGDSWGYFVDAL
mmetsp:Transcript_6740/g.6322  ORF Transcript_6740/g.6322 Transcript_6740/m.6322 type:complete len:92 (-) Transcript_6740:32-307(-)